jgi:hypothetical protein
VTPQRVEHRVVEHEPLDRVERASDTRHDAVPPAVGKRAREQLEDRPATGRAGLEGGLQHGQLVVVGQQRGGARYRVGRHSHSLG